MKKEPTEFVVPSISSEMVRNCKKAIAVFGFHAWEYEKFLSTVAAMVGEKVLQFPVSDIEKYRERYVKQYEHGFNDVFVFDAKSKIKHKNEDGKIIETGFFCPRLFWDFIIKSQ